MTFSPIFCIISESLIQIGSTSTILEIINSKRDLHPLGTHTGALMRHATSQTVVMLPIQGQVPIEAQGRCVLKQGGKPTYIIDQQRRYWFYNISRRVDFGLLCVYAPPFPS